MSENIKAIWLTKPGDNDYLTSLSYLGLIFGNKSAKKLVKALRKASMMSFKAKDMFRSSGLSLLGISNGHVEKNIKKDRLELDCHRFFWFAMTGNGG